MSKLEGDDMGINVGLACSQASALNNYAERLRTVRTGLIQYKGNLNEKWQATEMRLINNAIDELVNELQSIASSLESIGSDIRTTAYEIRNEEIERARAEARAREKAEVEARARAMKQN
jgi:peptidoglycan hydrolase CwlO-like protein